MPRGADGRRHRYQGTFPTYDAALEAARKIDYNASQQLSSADRDLTVGQLLQRWQASQPAGRHSTVENRTWLVSKISARLGTRRVQQLTAQDIQAFLTALEREGKAASTCNKCRQRLQVALDDAVDAGIIASNPAKRVRAARGTTKVREEAWTPDQVKAILRSAQQSRLYPLFVLAFMTGARLGELVGARPQDYDPATGTLHITGTAQKHGARGEPKTEAAKRRLPLPPEARALMEQHLKGSARLKEEAGEAWGRRKTTSESTRAKQREAARRRGGSTLPEGSIPPSPPAGQYEALFPTTHGTPWSLRNVRREWATVLERAGLPHRRFHSIRSGFATAALQNGVGIKDLQDAMGHTSPLMSLRYAQSVSGSEARVVHVVARHLGLATLDNVPTQEEAEPKTA
nr:site-specific integrase [Deinococcus budaensis]